MAIILPKNPIPAPFVVPANRPEVTDEPEPDDEAGPDATRSPIAAATATVMRSTDRDPFIRTPSSPRPPPGGVSSCVGDAGHERPAQCAGWIRGCGGQDRGFKSVIRPEAYQSECCGKQFEV